MKKLVRYAPEIRERRVQMVLEHRGENDSECAVVEQPTHFCMIPRRLFRWAVRSERRRFQGNASAEKLICQF